MEKVSTLLDGDENNWIRFGRKFEIPRKEINTLKPACPQSPTKSLIEHIVAKEPDLNMRSFLKSLANIKRFDVIKELKEFFYGKNVNYSGTCLIDDHPQKLNVFNGIVLLFGPKEWPQL